MTEAQFVFLIAFIACIAHGVYQALIRIFDRNATAKVRVIDATFALVVDLVIAFTVMKLWEHFH